MKKGFYGIVCSLMLLITCMFTIGVYSSVRQEQNVTGDISWEHPAQESYLLKDWQSKLTSKGVDLSKLTSVTFADHKKYIPIGTVPFSIGAKDKAGTIEYGEDSKCYDISVYIKDTSVVFYSTRPIFAPTDSSYLFSNSSTNKLSNLTSVLLGNFNTTYTTNFVGMFKDCSNISVLDLSKIEINSGATTTDFFSGCTNLKTIHTPKTTNVAITLPTLTDKSFYKVSDLTAQTQISTSSSSFILKAGALITANPNGGTISNLNGWKSATNPTKTVLWDNNAIGTLPDATKTGHTIAGWYTAQTSGTKITSTSTFDQNSTIFAQWTANKYQITYKDQGDATFSGTHETDYPTSHTYGTATTLKGATKTGYTFDGWFADKDCSGTKVTSLGATSYTSAITLYAKWTKNSYTVTYDAKTNGGSTANQTKSVAYGASVDLTLSATKDGWTFVGWNTSPTATTKLPSYTMPASDVTLYAIYSKVLTGTFKYYNNQTQTVTSTIYNTATSGSITAPAALGTPSGYTFRHWSTANTANATKTIDASKSITISANATYYASYQKTVTGTFFYSAGTTSSYSDTATQTSTTATAIQYMNYAGTKVESNFTVPSAVTSSVGSAIAKTYKGVSTSTNSTATTTPTTANTTFYAVYSEGLTFYYFDGTAHTNKAVERRMLSNGTQYKGSLDKDEPVPSAYDGGTFTSWQYQINPDTSYTRQPLTTGVNALYAKYTKSVEATFNYHNGTSATTAKASANRYYVSNTSNSVSTFNNTITVPSAVTANRTISSVVYTYRGVRVDDTANGTVLGASEITTANTTYYASYSYTVTLSFNGNGSTSGTAPSNVSGTAYMKYNGTKVGASLTLPVNPFAKTGYTLDSTYPWNANASGTGTTYKAQTAYTFTANATLYAKWTINSYVLTAHANGGTFGESSDWTINGETAKKYVDYNATYGSLPAISKTGFGFKGWFTSATGGTQVSGTTKMGTADTTIYAQWDANGYSIVYELNGGTNADGNPTSFTYSATAQTKTVNKPTRKGHTFNGWTVVGGSVSDVTLTIVAGRTSDVTLTANWTANEYNITYELDGGTAASGNPSKFVYSDERQTFEAKYPTKTGYTCTGWTANCGETLGTIIGIEAGWAQDVVVTAIWQAQVYTINYKDQGDATFSGTHESGYPTSHTYGTATTLKGATKTGYTFGGWFADKDCSGTKVTSLGATSYTSTITLYAKWTVNSYNYTVTVPMTGTAQTVTITANGQSKTVSANNGTATFAIPYGTKFTPSVKVAYTSGRYNLVWGTTATANRVASGTSVNRGSELTMTQNGLSDTAKLTQLYFATAVLSKNVGTDATYYVGTTNNPTTAFTSSQEYYFLSNTNITLYAKATFASGTYNLTFGTPAKTSISTGTVVNSGAFAPSYAGTTKTLTISQLYTLQAKASGNGTVTPASATYVLRNGSETITATPTNATGYTTTFASWAKTSGACTIASTTSSTTTVSAITADTVVTATFTRTANEYTIVYNGNGNTGGSTASSKHTYDVAKALTANGFTRAYTVTYNYNYTGSTNGSATANYTFSKWNTLANGTGTSYSDKQSVTNLATSGTFNLYAQWTSASITLPTPTRTGYTFGGWYKEANCTTIVGEGGASYTPTAATTLYAKWTINTYTVTITTNDSTYGSVDVTRVANVPYGTKLTSSSNTVTINGTTVTATPATTTAQYTYTFKNWTNGTATVTGNLTVTANFERTIRSYTLTANANGGTIATTSGWTGTGTTATKTLQYNAAYGTLPTVSREGYTFKGWYTAATNGTKVETTTKMGAAATTIWAQWTQNVSYFANATLFKNILTAQSVDTTTITSIIFTKSASSIPASPTKTFSIGASDNTGSTAYTSTSNCFDVTAYLSGTQLVIYSQYTIYAPVDSSWLFNPTQAASSTFSSLASIDFFNFDTSNVTNMQAMFNGCSSLTSLDVSSFNTAKVTDMSGMFTSGSKLSELNVSNFDTANVENMQSMFHGCSNLTNLDVSSFNTAKVTDMSSMFAGCSSLTNLNLSNFDTSNVAKMSNMFWGCTRLNVLDLSNFDTLNVKNMYKMFYNCSSLTSLNVSNFNTAKVTDMSSMFAGCSSLTSLNVRSFDTSNVTDMSSMFDDCGGLTSLDVSNFITSNVTDMRAMFNCCSSLTSLNLSNFDMAKVTTVDVMISDCSSLKTIQTPKNVKVAIDLPASNFFNVADLTTAYSQIPVGNASITLKRGYTLTANANNGAIATTSGWTGSGTTATKVVLWDSTISSFPTVSRTGYALKGWYTAATNGTKLETTSKISANTTIYAQWTNNTYTLTANANGGTIATTSGWTGTGTTATKTLQYNAEYGTLPTVSRDGYVFDGWYTAQTGGTYVSSSTKMTGATTIWAHWRVTYKVYIYQDEDFVQDVDIFGVYDINGEIRNCSNGADIATDEAIVLPNIANITGWKIVNMEGNVFEFDSARWGTSLNDVSYSFDSEYESHCILSVSADQTYYIANLASITGQKFIIYPTFESYDIIYKDKGGETFSGTHADGYPRQHTYGTDTTLKTASKTGYAFGGWFTTSDCSGTAVTKLGATDYKNNITLYAKWLVTYKVTIYEEPDVVTTVEEFELYDESGNIIRVATYNDDITSEEIISLPLIANTVGWQIISNGTEGMFDILCARWGKSPSKVTNVFTAGDVEGRGKLSCSATDYIFIRNLTSTPGGNFVIFPIPGYTINYKDKGGSEFSGTHAAGYPMQHVYGTDTTLKTATKTGYTFDGWFTNITCTGSAVTSLGGYDYDSDISLYAKWTINSYTLTADMNGGTLSSIDDSVWTVIGADAKTARKTLYFDQVYGDLPICRGEEGYEFDGWYTDIEGGTMVDDLTKMGGQDTTIYAHYSLIKYKVTFFYDATGVDDVSSFEVIDGFGNRTTVTDGYVEYGQIIVVPNITDMLGLTLTNTTNSAYGFSSARWGTSADNLSKSVSSGTINFALGDSIYIKNIAWTSGQVFEIKPIYESDTKTIELYLYEGNTSNTTQSVFDTGAVPFITSQGVSVTYNGTTTKISDSGDILVLNGAKSYTGKITFSLAQLFGSYTDLVDLYKAQGAMDPSAGVKSLKLFVDLNDGRGEVQITKDTADFRVVRNAKIIYRFYMNESYILTCDPNGGSVVGTSIRDDDGWGLSEAPSKTLLEGESINTLPTAERSGYEFAGWYTTPSTGGTQVTTSTTMFGENTTIYARWTPAKYDILYELGENGINNASNPAKYTYSTNYQGIKLYEPTRSGYKFVKWVVSGNSNATVSSSMSLVIPAYCTSKITLVAQWTKLYTVTFVDIWYTNDESQPQLESSIDFKNWENHQAGIGEYDVLDMYDGATDLPVATIDGYQFLGWRYGSTALDEVDIPVGGMFKLKSGAGTTLLPVFSKQYNVYFQFLYKLNGTEVEVEPSDPNGYIYGGRDYTYCAAIIYNGATGLPYASLTGYEFLGWFISGTEVTPEPNQMSVHFPVGEPVELPYGYSNWKYLYPVFKIVSYTLSSTERSTGKVIMGKQSESSTSEDVEWKCFAYSTDGTTWTKCTGEIPTTAKYGYFVLDTYVSSLDSKEFLAYSKFAENSSDSKYYVKEGKNGVTAANTVLSNDYYYSDIRQTLKNLSTTLGISSDNQIYKTIHGRTMEDLYGKMSSNTTDVSLPTGANANDTDTFWLMSYAEANAYFANDADRKWMNGESGESYWLRSPRSDGSNSAVIVTDSGGTNFTYNVYSSACGARAAFQLRLS